MFRELGRTLAVVSAFSVLSVGCGDRSGPASASPNAADSVVGSQLRELEESGRLPKLDLGSDVTGIDADNDGLRDDLARHISSLQENESQKSALRQLARAISATLTVDLTRDVDVRNVSRALVEAVNCTWDRYPGIEADEAIRRIRSVVVNTKARFDAYERYNAKRDGTVTTLPDGDTCN